MVWWWNRIMNVLADAISMSLKLELSIPLERPCSFGSFTPFTFLFLKYIQENQTDCWFHNLILSLSLSYTLSSLISPSTYKLKLKLLQTNNSKKKHNLIIFIISTIPKHTNNTILCVYIVVSLLLNVISTIYCHFITQSHPWSLLFYYFFYIHLFLRLLCLLLFACFASSTYFIYQTATTTQKLRIMQNLFYILALLILLVSSFSFICCCLFPLSYVVHISYNNFLFIYLFFILFFFGVPLTLLLCSIHLLIYLYFFYYFFNKIAARNTTKEIHNTCTTIITATTEKPWVSEVEWVRKSTYRFFQKYFLLLKCLSVCILNALVCVFEFISLYSQLILNSLLS